MSPDNFYFNPHTRPPLQFKGPCEWRVYFQPPPGTVSGQGRTVSSAAEHGLSFYVSAPPPPPPPSVPSGT